MSDFEGALAAVRLYVDQVGSGEDPSEIVTEQAALAAEDLARQIDPFSDMQAAVLLAAFYWYRYRYSSLPFGSGELIAGIRLTRSFAEFTESSVRGIFLNMLGTFLFESYRHSRELAELRDASDAFRAAVGVSQSDYQGRRTVLENLGIALRALYERTGDRPELEESVQVYREAIRVGSSDDEHRARMLTELGSALLQLAEITGDLDSVQESLSLHREALSISDNLSERGLVMGNLGQTLRTLYERTGDRQALEQAVQAYGEAVRAGSSDDEHYARTLAELGSALLEQAEITGDRRALEEAVRVYEVAVRAVAPGDEYRVRTLAEFGTALLGLAEITSDTAALHAALEFQREALSASEGLQERGLVLRSLGPTVRALYGRTGDRLALEEAIRAYGDAVTAPSSGYAERAAYLRELGRLLRTQYKHDGHLETLAASARADQEALRVAAGKDRASVQLSLGSSLSALFERTGDPATLEEAVRVGAAAIDGTREAAPDNPDDLFGLAVSMNSLYKRSGDIRAVQVRQDALRAWRALEDYPDRPSARSTGESGGHADSPGRGSGGAGDGAGGEPGHEEQRGRRFLLGRFPGAVRPDRVFSVLVSVIWRAGPQPESSVLLKPFDVPTAGKVLVLYVDAPGLRVLSDHHQEVRVPSGGDSEPVKFDFIGDTPGPQRISVTAWDRGSFLGELTVELAIERDAAARPDQTAVAPARDAGTSGEVTLLVRYDDRQKAFRFEFIDVDYPDEVTSELVYDPKAAVEQLVRRLNNLATGTAGYSAEATRTYLVNEGVQLWQQLLPERLRSQFWDRQQRITQLRILSNHDLVPWELLYPKDRGHDAGFLVEQFPVARAIYGRAPERQIDLRPARFVVPQGSPPEARKEARVLAELLGTRLTTVSELMPLLDLIGSGRFGLLHFACHNSFDPEGGASIQLDAPFTPTFLASAATEQPLAETSPLVFINACRSLGESPSYNRLDGWADKFLRAGAAAFIGSMWEVRDSTAREFARELYQTLLQGTPLGQAVMTARQAIASEPGDPTWLAYAVYGDPQATIT